MSSEPTKNCYLGDGRLVPLLDSVDYLSKKRFSLWKCEHCFLGHTMPPLTEEELGPYYEGLYYKKRKSGADSYINKRRIENIRKMLQGIEGKKLLDIGCGNGALIDAVERAGGEGYGSEMAPPEHFINESVQKRIYHGSDLESHYGEMRFDAITLWHVLEHLVTPKTHLLQAKKLLKDDGVLIIEVPSLHSWQFMLTKSNWFNLDMPRHVFHFSPQNLRNLLEQCGFRVERISHYSPIYSVFGFVQSFLNMFTNRKNILFDMLNGKITIKNYRSHGVVFWEVLTTYIFLIPVTGIALLLAFCESLTGSGGVITVYARHNFSSEM